MSLIAARALVVDDDERTTRLMTSLLLAEQVEAVAFTRLDDAALNAARVRYDLAFIDLTQPDVTADEAIARFCGLCPEARVIALAAFAQKEEIVGAMRSGARDILEKPVQAAALQQVLARQLAALGIAERDEQRFIARLGAVIRRVRQQGGRSLTDVAQEAGLSASQLSQLESGKNAASLWALARVAAALRTPIAALFHQM